VLIVLKTISKWLTFDSKFSTILRETGLLHILVDHCGRLCRNVALKSNHEAILTLDWFLKNKDMITRELRKVSFPSDDSDPSASSETQARRAPDRGAPSKTNAGSKHAAGQAGWVRWEERAMKVTESRVTKVLPSPEFSVALFGTTLDNKVTEWEVTVGRTSRGWCGVGVATKDIELGESMRQAGPAGKRKQGRAWFYHDRGFFCNGEVFCDDSVPPYDWKSGQCTIGVFYDAEVGEMTFSCNGIRIPGKISVREDSGLYPAVYCSDVGTWFDIESSKVLCSDEDTVHHRPMPKASAKVGQNKLPFSELKRKHFNMALKAICTLGEDAKMSAEIHYNTLAESIDRLVDFREVSQDLGLDLQGLTWEEKQVICDRIWAAANPHSGTGKGARRKQSIYSLLPSSWTLRLDSLVDLMISIADGEGAGIDEVEPVEIGQIALFILRTYVRLLDDFRSLVKKGDADDGRDTQEATSDLPENRSLVSKRSFDLVVETLSMMIAGNPTNMAIASKNGLFRNMLVLLQTDDFREGAIR
jgi:hypothetical protein